MCVLVNITLLGVLYYTPVWCTMTLLILLQVHPSRRFERRAKMSYDAANERIRIIDEDIMQNTTEYFDDLFLFKEVCISLAVSGYLQLLTF